MNHSVQSDLVFACTTQIFIFVLYSHLHLGQTQAFQRYPGYQEASEVQEPTPTQAVLSNVATSNSKPIFGTFEPKVVEPFHLLDFSTFPQVISLLIQIMSNSEIEKKISCKLAQWSQRKVQNLSLEKIWRERGHSEKGRVRHLQNGPQFHQFCKSLFRLKMT